MGMGVLSPADSLDPASHRFRSGSGRRRTYVEARALSLSDFPSTLDWRAVDGGAYLTKIVDQGQCGSCYAVAATDAVSMRRRIRRAVRDGTYRGEMKLSDGTVH